MIRRLRRFHRFLNLMVLVKNMLKYPELLNHCI